MREWAHLRRECLGHPHKSASKEKDFQSFFSFSDNSVNQLTSLLKCWLVPYTKQSPCVVVRGLQVGEFSLPLPTKKLVHFSTTYIMLLTFEKSMEESRSTACELQILESEDTLEGPASINSHRIYQSTG